MGQDFLPHFLMPKIREKSFFTSEIKVFYGLKRVFVKRLADCLLEGLEKKV